MKVSLGTGASLSRLLTGLPSFSPLLLSPSLLPQVFKRSLSKLNKARRIILGGRPCRALEGSCVLQFKVESVEATVSKSRGP